MEDGLSFATNQNNLLLQLKGLSSTEDYVNAHRMSSGRKPMPEPVDPAAAGREPRFRPQHDRITP